VCAKLMQPNAVAYSRRVAITRSATAWLSKLSLDGEEKKTLETAMGPVTPEDMAATTWSRHAM
jgi:hypothetical protein